MNIFSGGTKDYGSAQIRRVIDTVQSLKNDETGETETVTRKTVKIMAEGSGKLTVTLSPMRSLSVEDYSFPFQNTGRISAALKLQTLPYTAGGAVDIFPVTLSKEGRSSAGIVWYVSPSELDIPSPRLGHIWPSPLGLVSGLNDFDGSGVTMWLDEENICSLLWQSYRPLMYRWRKLSGSDPELREMSFWDDYCRERELDRGGNFVINASEGGYNISEIVAESVRICPWIAEVNLSRTVLEGARDLERTLRVLTRASCWLLAVGAVMLGAELLTWYHTDAEISRTRSRSESVYRETFDPSRTGRISNPVALARDKIASLSRGSDEGHPLDEVLADLGTVYSASQGITIDIMRYNADGIDCTGVASDMTAALNFRKAWEDRAGLVQVDNTQFVSGIGYRFDIRIRW